LVERVLGTTPVAMSMVSGPTSSRAKVGSPATVVQVTARVPSSSVVAGVLRVRPITDGSTKTDAKRMLEKTIVSRLRLKERLAREA